MAYDIFLKLDSVDGESTQAGHENEIEIFSFSWGVSNPPGAVGATGARIASKPKLADLSLTKLSDKASAKLFEACASGRHLKTATLTCRKANAGDYLVIKLQDVLVSDFVIGGHANSDTEDAPLDQISLNFQKIEFQYANASAAPSV